MEGFRLVSVLLMFLLKANADKFCEHNLRHVMCNATGVDRVDETKIVFKYPNNQSDRDVILDGINQLREKLAQGELEKAGEKLPKAASLVKLEWCDDCEKAAWNFIRECESTWHVKCCECTTTDDYVLRYANLISASTKMKKPFDMDILVSKIVNVSQPFDQNCIENVTFQCLVNEPKELFFLSDLMTRIGCAYTVCKEGKKSSTMSCFYNVDIDEMVNRPLYVKGDPCTECHPNSECTADSKVLCECDASKTCHPKPKPLGTSCSDTSNGPTGTKSPPSGGVTVAQDGTTTPSSGGAKVEKGKYCDYNLEHILCNATGMDVVDDSKFAFKYPNNDSERDVILRGFNKFRESLAAGNCTKGGTNLPKAAGLMTLKWCDECEKAAWNMIRDCKARRRIMCCDCSTTDDHRLRYLNLKISTTNMNNPFDIDELIEHIVNTSRPLNMDCLDRLTRECVIQEIKLLTLTSDQITHIGCAYSVCNSAGNERSFFCFFNLDVMKAVNQPMYAKGEPCSGCRANSLCDQSSNVLCECEPSKVCHDKPGPLGTNCRGMGAGAKETPTGDTEMDENSGMKTLEYCEFNSKHILCNATGIDVVTESRIAFMAPKNQDERDLLLRAMNEFREELASGNIEREGFVFPKASNLMKLKWCDECEKAAWNLLRSCKYIDQVMCCDCTNTGNLLLRYLNLKVASTDLSKPFDVKEIVERIVNGTAPFKQECFEKMTWGCIREESKFMTLASEGVTQIGCAYTVCDEVNNERSLLCFYDLNMLKAVDRPLYNEGEPCSNCRQNSQCTTDSTILCECDDSKICHEVPPPLGSECDKPGMIPALAVTPPGPGSGAGGEGSELDNFCMFNLRHILCNATGMNVLIDEEIYFKYPENKDEKDSILLGFNKFREKLASGNVTKGGQLMPKGSNLLNLKWCDECERAAWNMVKTCKHSLPTTCCDCTNTGNFKLNFLSLKMQKGNEEKSFDLEEVIDNIVQPNEPIDMNCLSEVTLSCYQKESKFLMLASDQVTHIGCAYTVCNNDEHETTLICFYDLDVLNVLHKPIYDEGDPCTNCPTNSQCTDDSKILCECDASKICHDVPPPLGSECDTDGGGQPRDNEVVKHDDTEFCNYDVKHWLCNATGIDVVDNSKLKYKFPNDQTEKDILIDAFNKIREDLANGELEKGGTQLPKSSNLMKLKWCDKCEAAAWNTIRNCQFEEPDSCCDCDNSGDMKLRYFVVKTDSDSETLNIDEIVEKILDKNKPFPPNCLEKMSMSCLEEESKFTMIGSQYVTNVGCAYSVCDQFPFEGTLVCFYNIDVSEKVDQPLYDQGEPCTNCPLNSECTENSRILCNCQPPNICHDTPESLGLNCPFDERDKEIVTFDAGPLFCEFSMDHILCNATGSENIDPDKVSYKFPDDGVDRKVMLEGFNKLREEIASGNFTKGGLKLPNAGNLMKLDWCETCESAALNMIKTCKYLGPKDCCDCRNTGENYLQPILITSKDSKTPGEFNLQEMMSLVAERNKPLDAECIQKVSNECFEKESNFLTVSNQQITKIGCAYTECKDNPQEFTFLCYADLDEKTAVDAPLYTEGNPCSACPPSAKCTSSSPILCECEESEDCSTKSSSLGEQCTDDRQLNDMGGSLLKNETDSGGTQDGTDESNKGMGETDGGGDGTGSQDSNSSAPGLTPDEGDAVGLSEEPEDSPGFKNPAYEFGGQMPGGPGIIIDTVGTEDVSSGKGGSKVRKKKKKVSSKGGARFSDSPPTAAYNVFTILTLNLITILLLFSNCA